MYSDMNIRTKHTILSLILMTMSMVLSAQKYHVEGEILDKATFTSMSNVNISFTGSRLGFTTDEKGRFSFDLDTLPVNMIISHVGYKTKRIWLDKPSGRIAILLESSATMLREVEIRGINEPRPFFKDDKYAVLDYQIDNDLVYLLIFRFHIAKSLLLCKTFSGDTIASSAILPFTPVELFLDCLGCLHLLSLDSAYQVYFDRDTLKLCYAFDIQKFDATVRKCVASTDKRMFFREESWHQQTVRFFYVDRNTKERMYMASASDEEKIKMLYKNPMDYFFLITDSIPDNFDYLPEYVYVKKILYKPNASVMHRIGDTLCVFSTTDGILELYNLSGGFINKQVMPIKEMGEGLWTKEIYIDPVAKLSYTSFTRNGILTLFRIDLNSGVVSRALSTIHAFPQKLKVYHDHLFYLYDVPGEGDNKHLFKQKL